MSDPRPGPGDEDDLLAAELAVRLLGDEALASARAREAADPAFAGRVADWNERLMPLLDVVSAVAPRPAMWARISAAIALLSPTDILALKRKLRFWRIGAGALTALAASLAIVVGMRGADQTNSAPAARSAPGSLLVASVAAQGASAMAVISYDRVGGDLIVAPAALTPVAGHSHELWVIPASGDPRSLGLIAPGAPKRIVLADTLAAVFAAEVTIAISAEQEGGSRTGLPAGPVVATGKLRRV